MRVKAGTRGIGLSNIDAEALQQKTASRGRATVPVLRERTGTPLKVTPSYVVRGDIGMIARRMARGVAKGVSRKLPVVSLPSQVSEYRKGGGPSASQLMRATFGKKQKKKTVIKLPGVGGQI